MLQHRTATEMRHCPDCRAPNPSARTHCFACGESLDKRPEGVPLPGQTTFTCVNCDTKIAAGAEHCPGCGRTTTHAGLPTAPPENGYPGHIFQAPPAPPPLLHLPDAMDRLRQVPPPLHWTVQPMSDGTVHMRRTTWGRFNADMSGPIACLLASLVLLRLTMAGGAVPVIALFLLLGLVGIGGILWALVAVEEIRTGPGFLEYHRQLFGFERKKRIDGVGILRVETADSFGRYGARHTTRKLIAQSAGTRIALESQTRGNDLFAGLGDNSDEAGRLAAFLAAQTGWPIMDPKGNFR